MDAVLRMRRERLSGPLTQFIAELPRRLSIAATAAAIVFIGAAIFGGFG